MTIQRMPSHPWWFKSNNSSKQSPWLMSTLSELDDKTKKMLKVIEEDADTFAKRAEMYYRKRPELISMIEDLYRSHRALAEQFDQLKMEGGARRSASLGSPFSDCSSPQKLWNEKCEPSESSSDSFDSEESEVDDPEQEDEAQVKRKMKEEPDKKTDADFVKLTSEVERLKEENASLKQELAGKDEQKREVIRQLCYSLDVLKVENDGLRKCIKENKKRSLFDFKNVKKGFLSSKFFGGHTKFETTIVAL